MQYTGPTYRFPPTVPERLYPTGVYVDRTLRVWAISRLRTARNFTEFFVASGYHHLPRVSAFWERGSPDLPGCGPRRG